MDKFTLLAHEIEKIINAGGLAPSGGNIQPWWLKIVENRIELRISRDRFHGIPQFKQLAAYFSVGSFVENVYVASNHLGLNFDSQLFDCKNLDEPVMRLDYKDRDRATDEKEDLFPFLEERQTNRKIHQGPHIPESRIQNFKDAVSQYNRGFQLYALAGKMEKQKVAKILGKVDALCMKKNSLADSMFEEMRWTDQETEKTRDGVDIDTLEFPAPAAFFLKLLQRFPILRQILPRGMFESMAKPLIMASSHVCCLSMRLPTTYPNLFTAGRVLEFLWLSVTQNRLSFHPWTIFTFMLMAVEGHGGNDFDENEKAMIRQLGDEFRQLFGMPREQMPVFFYRLFTADNPSKRSLRLDWKQYTELSS